MAVVKTYVYNKKTIRVWKESRGSRTLTRKFYVQYRLMMVTAGADISTRNDDSKVFDTLSQAKEASKEWMDSFGKDWRRYNEYCTHIEGTDWYCYDKGVCAKCYICEEGGERISEIIK